MIDASPDGSSTSDYGEMLGRPRAVGEVLSYMDGESVAVPLMFGGPGVPAVLARGDRGDTPLPG